MDSKDVKLLKSLLKNSRKSYRELANELELSVTAVHKRIAALKDGGIIQGFITTLNPELFKIMRLMVFGDCEAKSLDNVIKKLEKDPNTVKISVAGGNHLYIRALLEDISEIESYINFVKKSAHIPHPTVGIIKPSPSSGKTRLTQLDYQIINFMKDDSRKSYSKIAKELGVSPKTIRRRLSKLVEDDKIIMTINVAPESSNDTYSVLHLHLKKKIEMAKVKSLLEHKYFDNVITTVFFSNLTNFVLCLVLTHSPQELRTLTEKLENEEYFENVIPNIFYMTYFSTSWVDKMLVKRASLPGPWEERYLAKRIRKGKVPDKIDIMYLEEVQAYRRALEQALIDGVITEEEEAILASLRDSLEISEEQHGVILNLIRMEKKRTQREFKTYRIALTQALDDGVITDDEQAILRALRDTLDVSDEEHEKILNGIKSKKK